MNINDFGVTCASKVSASGVIASLHRRGARFALVTSCAGVGHGFALVLERV